MIITGKFTKEDRILILKMKELIEADGGFVHENLGIEYVDNNIRLYGSIPRDELSLHVVHGVRRDHFVLDNYVPYKVNGMTEMSSLMGALWTSTNRIQEKFNNSLVELLDRKLQRGVELVPIGEYFWHNPSAKPNEDNQDLNLAGNFKFFGNTMVYGNFDEHKIEELIT